MQVRGHGFVLVNSNKINKLSGYDRTDENALPDRGRDVPGGFFPCRRYSRQDVFTLN
jgi:hypothetical protein